MNNGSRRREEQIQKQAVQLRLECGSGRPEVLAEYLGVPVRYFPLGSLNGFYTVVLGQPFIVLHEDLEPGLRDAVLAHELGHHLLHRDLAEKQLLLTDYGIFLKESRLEYEANVFACHFLIPENDVLSLMAAAGQPDLSPGAPDLASEAARLSVPPELLTLKISLMGK